MTCMECSLVVFRGPLLSWERACMHMRALPGGFSGARGRRGCGDCDSNGVGSRLCMYSVTCRLFLPGGHACRQGKVRG